MDARQVNPSPPGDRTLDVLQVITTIDVGGAETHLLSLCRGLVGDGHRVHVVYLKGAGTLHPAFAQLGIRPEKMALERPAQLPACVFRLYRHLRRHRYSLVHTHLLKANFAGSIASRMAGNPRVLASKHNDEPQLLQPLIARLHRYSSKLDRGVICISRHVLEHTVRHGGVDPRKCHVVHYGVEEAAAAADEGSLRAELGLGASTPVIACVARLVPRKGHVHLLAAMEKIVDERRDAHLGIVGDGPERTDRERRCRERGLEAHVHFLGERLDVPRLLGQIDVFVLASEAEGLGRVILEAMAAGKPVVASRVGGIPEMVVDGETGFLVTPGDSRELAERILAILADRERAAEFGRAGRRRVEQRFSMRSMMDQTLAIYRAVATDG